MADSQPDIQLFNKSAVKIPLPPSIYNSIASAISEQEKCSFNFIEVVYVDENEIVRINNEHLDHNYVTDIITFRYDEGSDNIDIEGTLFCCAPRIVEQSKEFDVPLKEEFLRIYIHGLLHLVGYSDKTVEEKEEMTEKENFYLDQV